VYWKVTAITGILMSGKMSVGMPARSGVPKIASAATSGSSAASTMKV
jgi:hypothetical protein